VMTEIPYKPPDYMAAIAGARAWRMAPTLWARMGGLLWSHAMLNVWPDREEIVAECDAGHPAPAAGCSCGVYAWKSAEALLGTHYAPRDHKHIAGVVAGRGRVIRGHAGYWVAERATVVAFFDDGHPSPIKEVYPGSGVYLPTKEEVAEAYGVEVINYGDFEDFCDEYELIRF
jgi:hypothetical protein